MINVFWSHRQLAHVPSRLGQRALVLAGTLGDTALQVVTHLVLARTYHVLGGYPQAIDFLQQTLVALDGALLRERFGLSSAALGPVA